MGTNNEGHHGGVFPTENTNLKKQKELDQVLNDYRTGQSDNRNQELLLGLENLCTLVTYLNKNKGTHWSIQTKINDRQNEFNKERKTTLNVYARRKSCDVSNSATPL